MERLKDPETGEVLEVTQGGNCFFRVRGTDAVIGSNDPSRPLQVDVTTLLRMPY